MQPEGESPPTYGGNDSATEEGGGGQVPMAGEVLRETAYIQTRLYCRHHSLQGRDAIYLPVNLPSYTNLWEQDTTFILQ